MRPRRILIAMMVMFVAIGCNADNLTAPDNFYIGNRFPFGQNGNVVYQQVYSSSFFSGTVDITALSFFIADYAGPNTGFADGLYYISLSTTSKAVGGLDDTNLLSNLGSNNSTFFLGNLNGGSSISGTPFYYDPTQGNLLMTVVVTGNQPACQLDANNSLSCAQQGLMWRAADDTGTSRAWFSPDLVQYGFPLYGSDDSGLVTNFTYTAVPEPTSLLLLSTGLAGVLGIVRRKASSRSSR